MGGPPVRGLERGAVAMEPEQCIGLWIVAIRKRQGLTQAELAERIDRSVNALAALERGRSLPTFRTLRRIAGALGVPMQDFFAPTEEADPERHAALLRELLAGARALPLRDLEMTVKIVGVVAGQRRG